MKDLVPQEIIERKIYLIRECNVMLDSDLARLYGVSTKNLNKAVKRNADRFPEDFMFQLTPDEFKSLRFHFGTSKKGRGGRRYLPLVFTEQGVAMLSSVLQSRTEPGPSQKGLPAGRQGHPSLATAETTIPHAAPAEPPA